MVLITQVGRKIFVLQIHASTTFFLVGYYLNE